MGEARRRSTREPVRRFRATTGDAKQEKATASSNQLKGLSSSVRKNYQATERAAMDTTAGDANANRPSIDDGDTEAVQRLRRNSRLLTATVLVVGLLVIPLAASAYTFSSSLYSSYQGPPHFTFERNSPLYSGSNTGGELRAFVSIDGSRWRLRMRAGSGTTLNDCQTNYGWTPLGGFDVPDWWGTSAPKNWGVIRGVAFKITNMTCHDGSVTRTALYIHSEMDDADLWDWDDPGQPENQRWDGINDYKSEGCIKVHPYDILHLWDWFSGATQKSGSYGEVVA